MKHYNRRAFIRTSAAAISSLSIAGLPLACTGKEKSGKRIFKYALCSEIVREYSWTEQCDIIGNAGYDGVEIAPFTLVKEGVQEITASQRQQMVQDMQNAGISCAGLHWLFVPPPAGLHFTTPDENIRNQSVGYLRKLIDFCGDLGGEVMIFGSPKQRATSPGLTVEDAIDYFSDGLAQVADHAKDRNVKILIEPLMKAETDVVNTLGEAVNMVNKINHPAIATMFDIHHTVDETLPPHEIIRKYIEHIHHVHIQNMDGTLVMSDAIPAGYIPVFETLRDLNYQKWISLEVFDFTPGGNFIAEEGMKTFLEIEKRL